MWFLSLSHRVRFYVEMLGLGNGTSYNWPFVICHDNGNNGDDGHMKILDAGFNTIIYRYHFMSRYLLRMLYNSFPNRPNFMYFPALAKPYRVKTCLRHGASGGGLSAEGGGGGLSSS